MGHYLADLMCDNCAQIRCVCKRPKPVDASLNEWIIVDDYQVMRGSDYKKTDVAQRMRAFHYHYMMMEKYKTEASAKKNACKLLKAEIKEMQVRIELLKSIELSLEEK